MQNDFSSSLADKIQKYLATKDQKEVMNALEKATEWHNGQKRSSGEPYVTHPIATTVILAELEADKETLIAALLHDVVEDDRASLEEVEELFGATVASLVDGVTKLSKLRYEGQRNKRQIASLRKLLLSAHDDLRVILIKLADRWHNMQTIGALPPEKQERIAKETLDIYVPFARVLGLWKLKRELEHIAFPLAYPELAELWHKNITKKRAALVPERNAFLKRINEETTDEVIAETDCMTDYEVYQKLQGNMELLENSENIDTIHLRVQTQDGNGELLCYHTLGEIHKQYPVLTRSFRDYISAPQPNGYRALHTTIFLSQNHLLRLRIQTQGMFDHSVRRKVTDWAQGFDGSLKRSLGALTESSADDTTYMNDLKGSVLSKRMYIFTNIGEVISLPPGSTGVDFAFAVNPSHLRYLQGILINGEQFEVTRPLHEGDTVELVLSTQTANVHHKRMWLEKAKTVEAKEELKKALKHTTKDSRNKQAVTLLTQELEKEHLPAGPLFSRKVLQTRITSILGKTSFTDVLNDLATGLLPVSRVVDAYKEVIENPSSFSIRLLSLLGILPRSRVLQKSNRLIDIEIYAEDRPGLIHDITKCFAQRDINIAKFGVFAVPDKGALYKIRLEAKNFDHFSDLYDALLQVPDVLQVLRKR